MTDMPHKDLLTSLRWDSNHTVAEWIEYLMAAHAQLIAMEAQKVHKALAESVENVALLRITKERDNLAQWLEARDEEIIGLRKEIEKLKASVPDATPPPKSSEKVTTAPAPASPGKPSGHSRPAPHKKGKSKR